MWGDWGSFEALRAPLVLREEPALGLRLRGTKTQRNQNLKLRVGLLRNFQGHLLLLLILT